MPIAEISKWLGYRSIPVNLNELVESILIILEPAVLQEEE